MKSNYGRNIAIGIAVIVALAVMAYLGTFSFSKNDPLTTGQNQISMTSNNVNNVNAGAKVLPNGLSITDTLVGNGAVAESGMAVAVHYTGTLTDGTVFDSSYTRGEPIQFILGRGMVIPGWEQGIAGMKVGGKRHLVIPASLAYGADGIKDPSTGKYVIPENATLVFDTELIATAKIDPKTGQVVQ